MKKKVIKILHCGKKVKRENLFGKVSLETVDQDGILSVLLWLLHVLIILLIFIQEVFINIFYLSLIIIIYIIFVMLFILLLFLLLLLLLLF